MGTSPKQSFARRWAENLLAIGVLLVSLLAMGVMLVWYAIFFSALNWICVQVVDWLLDGMSSY